MVRLRGLRFGTLGLLLLVTCSRANAVGQTEVLLHGKWVDYPEGHSVARFVGIETEGNGRLRDVVYVTVARFDPKRLRLRVRAADPQAGAPLTLQNAGSSGNVVTAVNGGFVKGWDSVTPSGLLVVARTQLAPLDREDPFLNGVVCAGTKTVTAQHWNKLVSNEGVVKLPKDVDDCLQTGPLLVSNGKGTTDSELQALGKDTKEKTRLRFFAQREFNRAFVGTDAQSRVVVGVTTGVALDMLVHLLTLPSNKGGQLNLQDAVALHPSDLAGILVRSNNGRVAAQGSEGVALPSCLVVEK